MYSKILNVLFCLLLAKVQTFKRLCQHYHAASSGASGSHIFREFGAVSYDTSLRDCNYKKAACLSHVIYGKYFYINYCWQNMSYTSWFYFNLYVSSRSKMATPAATMGTGTTTSLGAGATQVTRQMLAQLSCQVHKYI